MDAHSHTHTRIDTHARTHAKHPVHVATFPKTTLLKRQTYPDVPSRKRKVHERVSHTPTHTHTRAHTHSPTLSCFQPLKNQRRLILSMNKRAEKSRGDCFLRMGPSAFCCLSRLLLLVFTITIFGTHDQLQGLVFMSPDIARPPIVTPHKQTNDEEPFMPLQAAHSTAYL